MLHWFDDFGVDVVDSYLFPEKVILTASLKGDIGVFNQNNFLKLTN